MSTTTMAVIVPTRGRRANILRMGKAWHETGAGFGGHEPASLWLVVDEDDWTTYRQVDDFLIAKYDLDVRLSVVPHTSMNGALNTIAPIAADLYDYIGFMGDDHVPRTVYWTSQMVETLSGGPCRIAYGNDLMQGQLLPTAVFMTSDIVRTLGYMAPRSLRHLFLDDTWKAWGVALGTLTYLSDVVIEHMHPQAAKAEWDDSYMANNSGDTWTHDRGMWNLYESLPDGLDADVAKLRAVME